MDIDIRKKKDELQMAAPVLIGLGYTPDMKMCGERVDVRPDIFLPSRDERRVGIEVTEYITPKKKESEQALYNTLKNYEKHFNQKSKEHNIRRHGFITVYFKEDIDPYKLNYSKIESQLIDELDSVLFPCQCPKENKYIANVVLNELSGSISSTVHLGAECYFAGSVNEELLMKRIKDKEKKLKDYKNIPENKTIGEYWLVIYASFIEHTENRYYKLPDDFYTQYNRIFFVDNAFFNQIK